MKMNGPYRTSVNEATKCKCKPGIKQKSDQDAIFLLNMSRIFSANTCFLRNQIKERLLGT
uniref:Uncharacterized protein n=1 Tax=Rhizophora mucronata TaxID=61149 RepID=A0A2P2Q8C9_RHIMU